jgi:hypothetical protein
LDVLQDRGDVLTVKREVQHWIYFRSTASRDLFKQAVAKSGYRIGSEPDGQADRPFGLTVFRTQSVKQEVVNTISLELLEMARRFDGEYDGWETQIMTQ